LSIIVEFLSAGNSIRTNSLKKNSITINEDGSKTPIKSPLKPQNKSPQRSLLKPKDDIPNISNITNFDDGTNSVKKKKSLNPIDNKQ